jgi:plastocyanin
MTTPLSVNRRRLAAAGALGVLLLAGCGSSGSSSTAAGGGAATTSGATASATGGATATMTGGATATGGSAGASSAADAFVIKDFMFSLLSLTVAPGAVVTVRNEDSTTHTLTDKADPSVFSTGDIQGGQSKTFTAPKKAGSYAFICSIHQYMTGTLVVR